MGTFLICRDSSDDNLTIWDFDLDQKETFTSIKLDPTVKLSANHQLASIGGYLLDWGPNEDKAFSYKLFEFDALSSNPLGGKVIQSGLWPVHKFWGYRGHYSANPKEQETLPLLAMGNFMMFFLPAAGRGTYSLFNFDPNPRYPRTSDPLPGVFTPQGGFPSIYEGHELISFGNYVLDRYEDGSSYRIWSFDPQNTVPLSIPEVSKGTWEGMTASHKVVAVGAQLMSWIPGELSYCLWDVKPLSSNPFEAQITDGVLPKELLSMTSITCFQDLSKGSASSQPSPGTIEYMQSKIKHVVYYMVESRSFDNVCGWLYENDQAAINFIGSNESFEGASTANYNPDRKEQVHQNKFKNGALSDQWDLNDQRQDPFHDTSDGLQQMFYNREPGYPTAKPDMMGFVQNNANSDVMRSYTPNQLPVLNGLANNFAVSDQWFSSVPGGTDINRAFSVSGSAMNRLDTWEGGSIYADWPHSPHRQSLWKVLYNHGVMDWKIYNVIDWLGNPFTYHLYLEGQIPSVDAKPTPYINSLETFKLQARHGELTAFSFLEPIWIAPVGTTSYHPTGDMVPAEMALNDIYESIKNGPNWEETLLVITFSKNGGLYDHVAPPYAAKPWPNDGLNGFEFDLLGPRVPTIFVSPWIKENTVIRSGESIPFDSTSFAATLLKWFGIPQSKWQMGDRMDKAPTFEKVFQESAPRADRPTFEPPFDKSFPG
jgi:phospholipase C